MREDGPEQPRRVNKITAPVKEKDKGLPELRYTNELNDAAKKLGAKLGENGMPLARGSEKIVYAHKDPDKILAFQRRENGPLWLLTKIDVELFVSPKILKFETGAERAQFLRQQPIIKILKILFPEQVPDVHDVYNREGALTREYVQGKSLLGSPEEFADLREYIPTLLYRLAFRSAIKKLGLFIDKSAVNFIRGEKGIVHIDNFYEYKNTDVIARRIAEAIKERYLENKISESERDEAMHHLERFKKLSTVKD